MSRPRRLSLAVLCGLVMLAFALRAPALEAQSLWRDETDALCYAFEFPRLAVSVIEPGRESAALPLACPPVSIAISPDLPILRRLIQFASATIQHNGPVYYFLLRGWVALAGRTPFALRYFSLLFGVLLVPLLYALGRRLFGAAQVGLWAAVCAAGAPYMAWYSQDAKMYALISALAVLTIYSLRRASGPGGRAGWWLAMLTATSLCMYVHILAALLIPVQFAMFLIWQPHARRKWIEALAAFACLTLPYLPLLVWQLPTALTPAQTGYPFYPLPDMVYTLMYGFAAGVVGHQNSAILIAPLACLAGAGLYLGQARRRDKIALLVWLILPVVALYLVSLLRPMFTDRYMIWIGPALYLLAALGLHILWRRSHWLAWLGALPLLIVFGVGIYIQSTQPIKSDFRAAARFVEQRAAPGDLIVFQIPHARYTFDYYYQPAFEWADGLFTNYGLSDRQVDERMRALLGARRVVWLVASEMPMWDQKLQVFGWLETHARRTDEGRFTLVNVFRYEMSDR